MSVTLTPLVARIERAADRGHGATFIGKDERTLVPWSQLHDDARVIAAGMQARGIQPGDHVAILGPTSRPLVTAIQACWIAGACSVVLPLPMRMGSIDEFVDQTRSRIRNADAALLLLDPDLAPFYEPVEGDPPSVLLPDLMPGKGRPSPEAYRARARRSRPLAILQFTSGSTSEPKGVMLPQRVLCANLDAIEQATALDYDVDVLVSWLPLYHDMGLVGCMTTPMTTGAGLVLASPQDFLAHPGAWMEWISTYKGTATAGPNFSWVLATRALKRMSGLDLSPMRIALNGAEPIDPDAVEAFVAAAAPHGFRPGAEFCAFGMAEVAIAGTFPPPMRGMVCDVVDRRVLETEKVAKPVDRDDENARRLPLLGTPVPGLEIRVVRSEDRQSRWGSARSASSRSGARR